MLNNYLSPFKDDIESYAKEKRGIIEQSILLWNIFYLNALKYKEKYPDIYIVRHEDMAMRPKEEFSKICKRFDIPFTVKMDKSILATTNVNNPKESVDNAIHTLNRNSEGLVKLFQERLAQYEINLIREKTEHISKHFYTAEDW